MTYEETIKELKFIYGDVFIGSHEPNEDNVFKIKKIIIDDWFMHKKADPNIFCEYAALMYYWELNKGKSGFYVTEFDERIEYLPHIAAKLKNEEGKDFMLYEIDPIEAFLFFNMRYQGVKIVKLNTDPPRSPVPQER